MATITIDMELPVWYALKRYEPFLKGWSVARRCVCNGSTYPQLVGVISTSTWLERSIEELSYLSSNENFCKAARCVVLWTSRISFATNKRHYPGCAAGMKIPDQHKTMIGLA